VGAELGGITGISLGPLLGAKLVVADGTSDGFPLGFEESSIAGLRLGTALNDGAELGAELVDTTGIAVGQLLGI
jgi:hypothetical protein